MPQPIDDALRLAPENTQLHILSAKVSIEQGQLEAAERELKMVRSLRRTTPRPTT